MTQYSESGRYFEVKFTPSSGAGMSVLDAFISRALAAGWTWVQSGNGTAKTSGTPGSSPFVGGTTGWAQLRMPGVTAELTLQRNTGNDYEVRAYVSHGGFGTGGTASAPPTAADGQQVIGTGGAYDAGGFLWASGSAAGYRWDICCDSVPSARGWCYWHIVGRVLATGVAHRRLVFAPVDTIADGGAGAADAAPYVLLPASTTFPTFGSGAGAGWFRKGLTSPSEAWDTALVLGGPSNFTSRGINTYTQIYETARVEAYKTSTNAQTKGQLTDRSGAWLSTSSAAVYDSVNLANVGGARIHYDSGWLCPWPSGVAPG